MNSSRSLVAKMRYESSNERFDGSEVRNTKLCCTNPKFVGYIPNYTGPQTSVYMYNCVQTGAELRWGSEGPASPSSRVLKFLFSIYLTLNIIDNYWCITTYHLNNFGLILVNDRLFYILISQFLS
ncbi:hypothetical protein RHMOL_Rhmol10G0246500 [Rhododendron molle]|uniref:Uncharacterized protein n=1 Tax=Rhododendron molle TaxID=49168 RepID=A0ACC0M6A6_RHOML|nr:hypothetical protein RHMOL_Rhmol10G0246500 [Rhododendron molle]